MIAFSVYGMPGPQGGWIIYTLAGSDGAVRYVGTTRQPIRRRLRAHLLRSKTEDTHKDRWLRRLAADGDAITCHIVETGTGRDWQEAERRWIAKLRAEGVDLANTSNGGEGCEGYKHSAKTRAILSSLRKGAKLTDSHREAISAALKGRPKSSETRQAMSGRQVSAETRRRMSEAQVGRIVSAETLAKMSAARKGVPLSDRARASRPKQLSDEHRAAIAAAMRKRWASA